jgi:hypothetical protein
MHRDKQYSPIEDIAKAFIAARKSKAHVQKTITKV